MIGGRETFKSASTADSIEPHHFGSSEAIFDNKQFNDLKMSPANDNIFDHIQEREHTFVDDDGEDSDVDYIFSEDDMEPLDEFSETLQPIL